VEVLDYLDSNGDASARLGCRASSGRFVSRDPGECLLSFADTGVPAGPATAPPGRHPRRLACGRTLTWHGCSGARTAAIIWRIASASTDSNGAHPSGIRRRDAHFRCRHARVEASAHNHASRFRRAQTLTQVGWGNRSVNGRAGSQHGDESWQGSYQMGGAYRFPKSTIFGGLVVVVPVSVPVRTSSLSLCRAMP
jgi:hypothetical protein